MDIIGQIIEEKGVSVYRAAKDLGESKQRISALLSNGAGFQAAVRLLVKLQKYSGKEWSEFGELLEEAAD